MIKNAEFNSFEVVCIDRSITGLDTDIFVPSFDAEYSRKETPTIWLAKNEGYENIPLLSDYSEHPEISSPLRK